MTRGQFVVSWWLPAMVSYVAGWQASVALAGLGLGDTVATVAWICVAVATMVFLKVGIKALRHKRRLSKVDREDWAPGGDELRAMLAEIRQGRFDGYHRAVEAARQGQWADRWFLSNEVAPYTDSDAVAQYVEKNRYSVAARFSMFMCIKSQGLHARKQGDEARAHTLLAAAEEHLLQACRIDPTDPTPYVFLIYSANYRRQGHEVARHYLAEALGRDPDSLPAASAMLHYLVDRGSSSQELLTFARSVATRPAGSELNAAIMIAYRWIWGTAPDAATRHWVETDPHARAEITASYDASLGAPSFRPTRYSVESHNRAAWFLFKFGDHARLPREVSAIGERTIDAVWTDFGDRPSYFAHARAAAGLT